jgi:hypothetical protein
MESGNFYEAFNHSDFDLTVMWRSAIDKAIKEMHVRGLLKKISKSKIPGGHQCVKSQWVFKIKRNSVF